MKFTGSITNNKGIDSDKDNAHLGGPDSIIIDGKFISCPKGEKRVDHEGTKDDQQGEVPYFKTRGRHHIAHENQGAEKNIVQEMVHIKAPFNEAGITLASQLTIKEIGNILQNNHQGDHPEEQQEGYSDFYQ